METPDKKQPYLKEDSVEALFDRPKNLKPPLMWFGLMFIPVLLGLISYAINDPPEPVQAPGVEVKAVVKSTPSGRGSSARSINETRARRCPYQSYRGKVLTGELRKSFERTGRIIQFLKENGAKTPFTNDKRINIYVDPSRIITRIECG